MAVKITPARLATLRLIAAGGVKVSEFRVGKTRVTGPDGRISVRVYDWLVQEGLADRDTSTSLFTGQTVHVTDAGRRVLDQWETAPNTPPARRIEVVVYRDPDGDTSLTYYLDGRRVPAHVLGIEEYDVDPGRNTREELAEWAESREKDAQGASPDAAAHIRRLVGYYV